MDDNTLLLLDFGDRGFAVVGGHFCQMGRVIGWGFTGIYGSRATIEITGLIPGTSYPAQIKVNPPSVEEELNLDAVVRESPAAPFITGPHTDIQEAHLWADICHLVDCILHDKEPIANAQHARHVIEIIEKGYTAAESGQTQKLRTRF